MLDSEASNNLLNQWSSVRAQLEVTFFTAVKSFDANISFSANFVLTVKNSNDKLFLFWRNSLVMIW